jgi:hypothetical protein
LTLVGPVTEQPAVRLAWHRVPAPGAALSRHIYRQSLSFGLLITENGKCGSFVRRLWGRLSPH